MDDPPTVGDPEGKLIIPGGGISTAVQLPLANADTVALTAVVWAEAVRDKARITSQRYFTYARRSPERQDSFLALGGKAVKRAGDENHIAVIIQHHFPARMLVYKRGGYVVGVVYFHSTLSRKSCAIWSNLPQW